MIEAKKSLPAAPYIMYMIERVTKVMFTKTIKHEPLHMRVKASKPLIRVLVINDNGLWINDFI